MAEYTFAINSAPFMPLGLPLIILAVTSLSIGALSPSFCPRLVPNCPAFANIGLASPAAAPNAELVRVFTTNCPPFELTKSSNVSLPILPSCLSASSLVIFPNAHSLTISAPLCITSALLSPTSTPPTVLLPLITLSISSRKFKLVLAAVYPPRCVTPIKALPVAVAPVKVLLPIVTVLPIPIVA